MGNFVAGFGRIMAALTDDKSMVYLDYLDFQRDKRRQTATVKVWLFRRAAGPGGRHRHEAQ
jgi:hypothetical protein